MIKWRGMHSIQKLIVPVESDQQKIFVDPNGSDGSGTGTRVSPYATLTKAFTMVTATRKIIILAPGSYAEAAAMTWPVIDGLMVIGAGKDATYVSATTSAGGSVLTVAPGAVSSTFDGMIQGVNIVHDAGSAQKGVTFSNASMGKKLLFVFEKCAWTSDAATDKSINLATHSDASNGVRIYVRGDGTQGCDVGGATYFVANNDGDKLQFDSMWLSGLVTMTGGIEARLRMLRCVYPEGAATTGDSGLQVHTLVNCMGYTEDDELTAEIFTAGDTSDIGGTPTKVIVSS